MTEASSTRCRDAARQELEQGWHLPGADECARAREEVGRRLVRQRPRSRFGVVDHRHVDLVRVRLRLSTAGTCRDWPLRRPESSSLTSVDAAKHGCRLRPYRGPISLDVIADERTIDLEHVLHLRTDRDGYVEVAFADIDAALRSLGAGGLDDFIRLELGHEAWAGGIDLRRLRALLAEYHYRWVKQGRGSPALFLHRHGERGRGDDAHALALEARLARQERDLALIDEGRLSPRAFIDRHVWSPFRRLVEQMLHTTP